MWPSKNDVITLSTNDVNARDTEFSSNDHHHHINISADNMYQSTGITNDASVIFLTEAATAEIQTASSNNSKNQQDAVKKITQIKQFPVFSRRCPTNFPTTTLIDAIKFDESDIHESLQQLKANLIQTEMMNLSDLVEDVDVEVEIQFDSFPFFKKKLKKGRKLIFPINEEFYQMGTKKKVMINAPKSKSSNKNGFSDENSFYSDISDSNKSNADKSNSNKSISDIIIPDKSDADKINAEKSILSIIIPDKGKPDISNSADITCEKSPHTLQTTNLMVDATADVRQTFPLLLKESNEQNFPMVNEKATKQKLSHKMLQEQLAKHKIIKDISIFKCSSNKIPSLNWFACKFPFEKLLLKHKNKLIFPISAYDYVLYPSKQKFNDSYSSSKPSKFPICESLPVAPTAFPFFYLINNYVTAPALAGTLKKVRLNYLSMKKYKHEHKIYKLSHDYAPRTAADLFTQPIQNFPFERAPVSHNIKKFPLDSLEVIIINNKKPLNKAVFKNRTFKADAVQQEDQGYFSSKFFDARTSLPSMHDDLIKVVFKKPILNKNLKAPANFSQSVDSKSVESSIMLPKRAKGNKKPMKMVTFQEDYLEPQAKLTTKQATATNEMLEDIKFRKSNETGKDQQLLISHLIDETASKSYNNTPTNLEKLKKSSLKERTKGDELYFRTLTNTATNSENLQGNFKKGCILPFILIEDKSTLNFPSAKEDKLDKELLKFPIDITMTNKSAERDIHCSQEALQNEYVQLKKSYPHFEHALRAEDIDTISTVVYKKFPFEIVPHKTGKFPLFSAINNILRECKVTQKAKRQFPLSCVDHLATLRAFPTFIYTQAKVYTDEHSLVTIKTTYLDLQALALKYQRKFQRTPNFPTYVTVKFPFESLPNQPNKFPLCSLEADKTPTLLIYANNTLRQELVRESSTVEVNKYLRAIFPIQQDADTISLGNFSKAKTPSTVLTSSSFANLSSYAESSSEADVNDFSVKKNSVAAITCKDMGNSQIKMNTTFASYFNSRNFKSFPITLSTVAPIVENVSLFSLPRLKRNFLDLQDLVGKYENQVTACGTIETMKIYEKFPFESVELYANKFPSNGSVSTVKGKFIMNFPENHSTADRNSTRNGSSGAGFNFLNEQNSTKNFHSLAESSSVVLRGSSPNTLSSAQETNSTQDIGSSNEISSAININCTETAVSLTVQKNMSPIILNSPSKISFISTSLKSFISSFLTSKQQAKVIDNYAAITDSSLAETSSSEASSSPIQCRTSSQTSSELVENNTSTKYNAEVESKGENFSLEMDFPAEFSVSEDNFTIMPQQIFQTYDNASRESNSPIKPQNIFQADGSSLHKNDSPIKPQRLFQTDDDSLRESSSQIKPQHVFQTDEDSSCKNKSPIKPQHIYQTDENFRCQSNSSIKPLHIFPTDNNSSRESNSPIKPERNFQIDDNSSKESYSASAEYEVLSASLEVPEFHIKSDVNGEIMRILSAVESPIKANIMAETETTFNLTVESLENNPPLPSVVAENCHPNYANSPTGVNGTAARSSTENDTFINSDVAIDTDDISQYSARAESNVLRENNTISIPSATNFPLKFKVTETTFNSATEFLENHASISSVVAETCDLSYANSPTETEISSAANNSPIKHVSDALTKISSSSNKCGEITAVGPVIHVTTENVEKSTSAAKVYTSTPTDPVTPSENQLYFPTKICTVEPFKFQISKPINSSDIVMGNFQTMMADMQRSLLDLHSAPKIMSNFPPPAINNGLRNIPHKYFPWRNECQMKYRQNFPIAKMDLSNGAMAEQQHKKLNKKHKIIIKRKYLKRKINKNNKISIDDTTNDREKNMNNNKIKSSEKFFQHTNSDITKQNNENFKNYLNLNINIKNLSQEEIQVHHHHYHSAQVQQSSHDSKDLLLSDIPHEEHLMATATSNMAAHDDHYNDDVDIYANIDEHDCVPQPLTDSKIFINDAILRVTVAKNTTQLSSFQDECEQTAVAAASSSSSSSSSQKYEEEHAFCRNINDHRQHQQQTPPKSGNFIENTIYYMLNLTDTSNTGRSDSSCDCDSHQQCHQSYLAYSDSRDTSSQPEVVLFSTDRSVSTRSTAWRTPETIRNEQQQCVRVCLCQCLCCNLKQVSQREDWPLLSSLPKLYALEQVESNETNWAEVDNGETNNSECGAVSLISTYTNHCCPYWQIVPYETLILEKENFIDLESFNEMTLSKFQEVEEEEDSEPIEIVCDSEENSVEMKYDDMKSTTKTTKSAAITPMLSTQLMNERNVAHSGRSTTAVPIYNRRLSRGIQESDERLQRYASKGSNEPKRDSNTSHYTAQRTPTNVTRNSSDASIIAAVGGRTAPTDLTRTSSNASLASAYSSPSTKPGKLGKITETTRSDVKPVEAILPDRTILRRQRRLLSRDEQKEDPVERLNRLRAQISASLSEVKGVLTKYSVDEGEGVPVKQQQATAVAAAVETKRTVGGFRIVDDKRKAWLTEKDVMKGAGAEDREQIVKESAEKECTNNEKTPLTSAKLQASKEHLTASDAIQSTKKDVSADATTQSIINDDRSEAATHSTKANDCLEAAPQSTKSVDDFEATSQSTKNVDDFEAAPQSAKKDDATEAASQSEKKDDATEAASQSAKKEVGPVFFRFVKKVRRRSTFDEDDENLAQFLEEKHDEVDKIERETMAPNAEELIRGVPRKDSVATTERKETESEKSAAKLKQAEQVPPPKVEQVPPTKAEQVLPSAARQPRNSLALEAKIEPTKSERAAAAVNEPLKSLANEPAKSFIVDDISTIATAANDINSAMLKKIELRTPGTLSTIHPTAVDSTSTTNISTKPLTTTEDNEQPLPQKPKRRITNKSKSTTAPNRRASIAVVEQTKIELSVPKLNERRPSDSQTILKKKVKSIKTSTSGIIGNRNGTNTAASGISGGSSTAVIDEEVVAVGRQLGTTTTLVKGNQNDNKIEKISQHTPKVEEKRATVTDTAAAAEPAVKETANLKTTTTTSATTPIVTASPAKITTKSTTVGINNNSVASSVAPTVTAKSTSNNSYKDAVVVVVVPTAATRGRPVKTTILPTQLTFDIGGDASLNESLSATKLDEHQQQPKSQQTLAPVATVVSPLRASEQHSQTDASTEQLREQLKIQETVIQSVIQDKDECLSEVKSVENLQENKNQRDFKTEKDFKAKEPIKQDKQQINQIIIPTLTVNNQVQQHNQTQKQPITEAAAAAAKSSAPTVDQQVPPATEFEISTITTSVTPTEATTSEEAAENHSLCALHKTYAQTTDATSIEDIKSCEASIHLAADQTKNTTNMPELKVSPAPVQAVPVPKDEFAKKKFTLKKIVRKSSVDKVANNKQKLTEQSKSKKIADAEKIAENQNSLQESPIDIEFSEEISIEEPLIEPEPIVIVPPPRPPRKIRKKVIIKRQHRKLSVSDTFFNEPLMPADDTDVEIVEKAIEYVTDDEADQAEEELSVEPPKPLKTCIRLREYQIGDQVLYAERYKKTMVRWKRGIVMERITSISYKLDIDGKEVPAHISYIKRYTDRKVNFGGKEYLEIDYEQIEEEQKKVRSYSIWNMV